MSKVELLIHPDDLEAVAAMLLGYHELELSKPETGPQTDQPATEAWPALDSRLTDLAQRLHRLLEINALASVERSQPPEEIRPSRDISALENVLANTEERMHSWQQELISLAPEREQLKCIREEIDWLNANQIPWEELLRLELLHFMFGWIPAGQADKMDLTYQHTPLLIMFLPGKAGRVFVLAFGVKSDDFMLAKTLSTIFFEPLELCKSGIMSKGGICEAPGFGNCIRERLRDVEHRQQIVENQRRHLADIWGKQLLAAWQRARNDLKVVKLIEQYALPADGFYAFSGLLPDKKTDQFTLNLKRAVKNAYALFFTDTGKGMR